MDSCYYYREYKLPKGNLDSTVDCTYVLIMHDSPREDQIYQHIMKAEPTSRVIFQYNYGYKKCNKSLRKNKPNIDLEHAVKTMFKHALDSGYKRILVLEDDCEFDERITHNFRQIEFLEKGCTDLSENSSLKDFFSLILTLGNFMNYETKFGNAYGFKLETLGKVRVFFFSNIRNVRNLIGWGNFF